MPELRQRRVLVLGAAQRPVGWSLPGAYPGHARRPARCLPPAGAAAQWPGAGAGHRHAAGHVPGPLWVAAQRDPLDPLQGYLEWPAQARLSHAYGDARHLPAVLVDVLGVVQVPGMPLVHTDDSKIAAVAAEHLLERGFRNFAFCEYAGEFWSVDRREGFQHSLRQRGLDCSVYQLTVPGPGSGGPQVTPGTSAASRLPGVRGWGLGSVLIGLVAYVAL